MPNLVTNTAPQERYSNPMAKLDSLLREAATILRDNSDLKIARIALNEHGVHTFLKIPGYSESDPLLEAITAYREGLAALRAIREQITRDNEDGLVEQTYGPHMRALLEWDKAAISRQSAIEAMKLMAEEDVFVDEIGEALRRAVLGYLESLKGVI
ncbi:hypothetical protein SAMN05216228_1008103 [Rhizobium tibeticum]|uniref:Uncharacterized protein n=2 Tax=Rhizobium tibeticum TaxID=501024 RepID=A0A1H8JZF0_9HYPH|nr:hypothetical protein RTCCBAU85039_2355 [Rhizobium tibeticum]SEN85548.1 hypothetical protein SAMN05216228_1008103 [Rhizobium tibeticum]